MGLVGVPGLVAAAGQLASEGATREPPGSVTGHVTCSVTNGPARLAAVALQPVAAVNQSAANRPQADAPHFLSQVVQTSLDGSFVIAGVPPGEYYVVADMPGYRTASTMFTREQMEHPTAAQMKQMAEVLTAVSVGAGRASAVEIRLQRGALLAGRVRFDDGMPLAPQVKLYRKTADGSWQPYTDRLMSMGRVMGERVMADDAGRFRFAGLGAGEYRVSADLRLEDVETDSVFGEGFSSVNQGYDLQVFASGTAHAREARTIELKDGQSEAGVEIEIPLAKLHAISGSLVEEGTGHRVNAGTVTLVYADDEAPLASVQVGAADEKFHFPFVPEGKYLLNVTEAKEVSRSEVIHPDAWSPVEVVTRELRNFGDAMQPLLLTTDAQIVVSVPAKRAAGEVPQPLP